AAKRLAFGKCLNAGQVCVSPDYILCPQSKVQEFTSEFIESVKASYPALHGNADFTSIINERHFSRLKSYLEDAEKKGAQIISSHDNGENLTSERKMPVSLVLNATEDMLVLKEEIFGPILPIIPYDSFDEAISYVNARPRPLALYYFDWDKRRAETVLKKTHSGGVCVNDTMTHVAADDIPFGGIGPSGMGHYHGKEGFLNFSKAKAVVTKGRINSTEFVAPPWGNTMYRGLMKMMKWRHGL
ncbi:MAG: aldehyde dehydrogenase family protein, partial [Aquisalinus sp.]|nr:aldehyde dehydrogenase family protein [Aquisalinus sp.]